MVGLPFFKKKEEPVVGKGEVPVERVKEMSSRGFSEPEIIDVLRKEGYSPKEIDQAFSLVLKSNIGEEKSKKEKKEAKKEEIKLPTLQEIVPKPVEPEIPETTLPQEYYQYSAEEYANYIDSIVQARVSEVSGKITELSAKYDEVKKQIEKIVEQLGEMTKERVGEEKRLLNRIDSFKESLEELNIKVGSLERAFKETLPALIESVRALSDLVQRIKKGI